MHQVGSIMTTTISFADQICAELEAIETNPALREETNFVGRADALDRIEFHLLDPINAVDVPSDDLVHLKKRAQFLFDQLAKIDQDIFQRLRARIADGTLRGDVLGKEFERYLCNPGKSDRGYDPFDIFVNGLLRLDRLPHETRPREPEMVFYQPTPARVILELTEIISITPKDVFYDLGSGLGQVCILVHLLTGARTCGIEFEPAYCDYARQSAERLKLAHVEFISTDARDADYAEATIFFMYTPFKGSMMTNVLQRIEFASRGRAVHIFTYGECTSQVSKQPWLELVAQRHKDADALAVFKRSEFARER